MMPRKELFKNTLRKVNHALKRITELRLTGGFCVYVLILLIYWYTDALG